MKQYFQVVMQAMLPRPSLAGDEHGQPAWTSPSLLGHTMLYHAAKGGFKDLNAGGLVQAVKSNH
jgi:hypothetical protein